MKSVARGALSGLQRQLECWKNPGYVFRMHFVTRRSILDAVLDPLDFGGVPKSHLVSDNQH